MVARTPQAASPQSSTEPASTLSRAKALHGAGRLEEAKVLYGEILKADPNQFDSLFLIAVIHFQRGDFKEVVRRIDAVLKINPNSAAAVAMRAIALQRLGCIDEAVATYDRAIALAPDDASAFYNRGNALQELKRFEDAVASYDRAIALKPDHVGAFYNRGNALQALDRLDQAITSYDSALALEERHGGALSNRGVALHGLKRLEEAIASYDRAVALGIADSGTFSNRGTALLELKQFADAVVSYDRAIAIDADNPTAFFNRGNALYALNRYDQALASYEHAIALDYDYAEAINNRAVVLKELNRFEQALTSCDRAIAIKPNYADAHNNRGVVLQALRRYRDAIASYSQALALQPDHKFAFSGLADCGIKTCDWSLRDKLTAEVQRRVMEARSDISPFLLLGYSDDAALQMTCARNYVIDRLGAAPQHFWSGARWHNPKIKLAYLSSDFRLHPTSFLMAELFEVHDRTRFEVFGVSHGLDDGSDMRARLVAAFDRFIDVRNMGDEEVARLLNDLRIDIAVDLNGHTQGARLPILAFRPAPIQVSYLGFPATMGADFIDYLLADPIVVPVDQQVLYTERVVHLPDCYQVNDRKRTIAPRTPTREELGLPADGFVFCCFNNNSKITPGVFDVWMHLLAAVDRSVLWLFHDNEEAEQNLRREAAARGVDPTRLVFAERMQLADHLARHQAADLFLDTLPCNAHTTASDALWAGVPVVTCRGKTFAGRVAASLLNAAQLSELVTENLVEYEALALRLATDRSVRLTLREKLARDRTRIPLFDTDRFCQHIEAAYSAMWEVWQRGERPRSFSVKPRLDRATV